MLANMLLRFAMFSLHVGGEKKKLFIKALTNINQLFNKFWSTLLVSCSCFSLLPNMSANIFQYLDCLNDH